MAQVQPMSNKELFLIMRGYVTIQKTVQYQLFSQHALVFGKVVSLAFS